jgi:hypothetical protein
MIDSDDIKCDVDLLKIHNLFSFNVNFSDYVQIELLKQDSSYIEEKFNHWIGNNFESVINEDFPETLYVNNIGNFLELYNDIWKSPLSNKTKRLLCYLQSSKNMNLINMVDKFQKYIGDINLISEEEKRGLFPTVKDNFLSEVLIGNKPNIKIILRDMKLKNILK